jgi:hypothetical protein
VNLLIGLLLAIATTNTPRPSAPVVVAATEAKTPVFLQSEAEDVVGAVYVAKFREALSESSRYRPVTTPGAARFVVGIITMDPNEAEPTSGTGQSTVAAITLQLQNEGGLNQIVYSWVLVARPGTISALAGDLLPAMEKESRNFEGVAIR